MIARGIRLARQPSTRLHKELFTYMTVDMTVKTYRGTRAKKGAIAIKQLPKRENKRRFNTTIKKSKTILKTKIMLGDESFGA